MQDPIVVSGFVICIFLPTPAPDHLKINWLFSVVFGHQCSWDTVSNQDWVIYIFLCVLAICNPTRFPDTDIVLSWLEYKVTVLLPDCQVWPKKPIYLGQFWPKDSFPWVNSDQKSPWFEPSCPENALFGPICRKKLLGLFCLHQHSFIVNSGHHCTIKPLQ